MTFCPLPSSSVVPGPDCLENMELLEDELKTIECVAQESLRLAQQSITLRKVMTPLTFTTEAGSFELPQGLYIATLLSVTNVDKTHLPEKPFPLTAFDPKRYIGHSTQLFEDSNLK